VVLFHASDRSAYRCTPLLVTMIIAIIRPAIAAGSARMMQASENCHGKISFKNINYKYQLVKWL